MEKNVKIILKTTWKDCYDYEQQVEEGRSISEKEKRVIKKNVS